MTLIIQKLLLLDFIVLGYYTPELQELSSSRMLLHVC